MRRGETRRGIITWIMKTASIAITIDLPSPVAICAMKARRSSLGRPKKPKKPPLSAALAASSFFTCRTQREEEGLSPPGATEREVRERGRGRRVITLR